MIKNLYETGECPKDVTEVIMIVFKKQQKTTKCNEHHTQSKDSSEDTQKKDGKET